jgi:pyridinium-3,5-biscarboxylic acid mononucleotide synthase
VERATDARTGAEAAAIGTEMLAVLEGVQQGELSPADALARMGDVPFRDLGFARVDTHRELRQGAPEAILAEGKTPDEIEAIARALLESDAGSVLVTRADAAARAALRRVAPDAEEDARARLAWVARRVPAARGLVTIVSGGTSDGPVVTEARVRAELLGTRVAVHADAGVAGLHRLAPALEDLRRADCVVVVAGQDAALASVVGGLVAAPVIGVPTSTGYGAALSGVTALLSMLISCAAGVAVVNIDDGFGAGTIAARIARSAGGAE